MQIDMNMCGRSIINVFTILLCLYSGDGHHVKTSGYTPEEFARLASRKLTENTNNFFAWDYGGALVFDGLYEVNKTFGLNYEFLLGKYLDKYETDPASFGYKVLHGITVPFYPAIGDEIGLFPIVYLYRAAFYQNLTGWDFYIAKNVADKYVAKWPKRLSDGTVSRTTSWHGEPSTGPTFLWADDQYMGLTLMARLGRLLKNPHYVEFVANQRLLFNQHLQDPEDGLFFHGYNDADKHHSCCKWGRANGWSITASVEILLSLKDFKDTMPNQWSSALQHFEKQAEAMLRYQSDDGRWRQVINESSTFLETSCTAMILSALSRGVTEGWLNKQKYSRTLDMAWKGLQSVLQADGTVDGVCSGTGIQTSVEDYEKRPTTYLNSRNGAVGSVLHAAAHYANYKNAVSTEL